MALIVRALAATYYDGHHIEPHAHAWGQLIFAASGVMRVTAQGRLWLVPTAQALWAPAGVRHEIFARGDFAMRTLYLAPALASALPSDCRAIEVNPLLRELVLHIVGVQLLEQADPLHRAWVDVLMDRLGAAEVLPFSLPLPQDPRALRAAERLREDLSGEIGLPDLARQSGASVRTLQRLFLQETGLRLMQWRQRLRLIHAAGLLAAGESVTGAGLEVGYASVSAFIAAFRQQFGRTPARLHAPA
jgi:AraC-like DNA-binding protein